MGRLHDQQRHEKALRHKKILQAIARGLRTSSQIYDALSTSASTTIKDLAEMRTGRNKQIWICDWVGGEYGGSPAPVYDIGNFPDVPKPERRKIRRRGTVAVAEEKPVVLCSLACANDPWLAWIPRRAA